MELKRSMLVEGNSKHDLLQELLESNAGGVDVGIARVRIGETPSKIPEDVWKSADVAILDLMFDDIAEGARFFLHERGPRGLLTDAVAVFLVTQFPRDNALSGPEITTATQPGSHPYFAIFAWESLSFRHLIRALRLRFHRGALAQGNVHDLVLAGTPGPVLIVGESGSGKDSMAEAIHWYRHWRGNTDRKFTVINCPQLRPELAHGELFGWVKGTFGGALDHRPGLLLSSVGVNFTSQAAGAQAGPQAYRTLLTGQNGVRVSDNGFDAEVSGNGTVVLDELGDLPPDVQAEILVFSQKGEIRPLGYPGVISGIQPALIAATSDPAVARLVGEELISWRARPGELREDLVNRLNFHVIRMEPFTVENTRRRIDRLVAEQRTRTRVVWTDDALDTLHALVKQAINRRVDDIRRFRAGEPVGSIRAFGDLRELSSFVKRLSDMRMQAEVIGVRGWPMRQDSIAVDGALVEQNWRVRHHSLGGEVPSKTGISLWVDLPQDGDAFSALFGSKKGALKNQLLQRLAARVFAADVDLTHLNDAQLEQLARALGDKKSALLKQINKLRRH